MSETVVGGVSTSCVFFMGSSWSVCVIVDRTQCLRGSPWSWCFTQSFLAMPFGRCWMVETWIGCFRWSGSALSAAPLKLWCWMGETWIGSFRWSGQLAFCTNKTFWTSSFGCWISGMPMVDLLTKPHWAQPGRASLWGTTRSIVLIHSGCLGHV